MKFGEYTRHGVSDAGYGSFGKVYFYRRYDHEGNYGNIVYGAKIVPLEKWNDKEADILRECEHENVVRYINFLKTDIECMVVTELLNTSLYDALSCKPKSLFAVTHFKDKMKNRGDVRIQHLKFQPQLDEDEIINIINNCFCGLEYLHTKSISHRDLSTPNILLLVKPDGYERIITAKLCDFGMSTIAPHDENCTTCLENAFYSAPEAQQDRPQYDSFAADIFSFGVVICECFMSQLSQQRTINRCRTNKVTFQAVAEECMMRIGASKFREFQPLLSNMISAVPKRRPSVQEASQEWRKHSVHDVTKSSDNITTNTVMTDAGAIDDTAMDVDVGDDFDFDRSVFDFLKEKYPLKSTDDIIATMKLLAQVDEPGT